MNEGTSSEPARPSQALTGEDFVAWCRSDWHLYENFGGICRLLSLKPLDLDARGRARAEVEVLKELCNPMGMVHGGAITMILDEVGGLAASCLVHFANLRSTIETKTSFYKRVAPGRLTAEAQVMHRAANLLFIEAALLLPDGRTAARASSTYLVSREAPSAQPGPWT